MTNKKTSSANEIQQGKTCAMLAYLLIGIIWFFVDEKMRKNDFAKYHVKQALVLLILSLAGSIALGMTWILVWLIPFWQIAVFVLIIIGIINANNSQEKELPLIGQFGDKFKF